MPCSASEFSIAAAGSAYNYHIKPLLSLSLKADNIMHLQSDSINNHTCWELANVKLALAGCIFLRLTQDSGSALVPQSWASVNVFCITKCLHSAIL